MGEARLRRLGRNQVVSDIGTGIIQYRMKRVARGPAGAWSSDRGESVSIVGFDAISHAVRTVPPRCASRLRKVAFSGVVALAGFASVASASAAQGQSRFASYASEAECLGSHTLSASVCRSAFANARQEYEAKTPSFASQTLCQRRFASCMAWPPDGSLGRETAYRPEWDGVDIVDTPTEQTVTPSPGSTGRSIRFAARPLNSEPQRDLVIRGAAPGSRGVPMIAARPGHAPSTSPFNPTRGRSDLSRARAAAKRSTTAGFGVQVGRRCPHLSGARAVPTEEPAETELRRWAEGLPYSAASRCGIEDGSSLAPGSCRATSCFEPVSQSDSLSR